MARRSGRRHPHRDVTDHDVIVDAAKILNCFLSDVNSDSQTQAGGGYSSPGRGRSGRGRASNILPGCLDETDSFPYADESDGDESGRERSGSRNNRTASNGRGNGVLAGSSSPRKRTHHHQPQPSSPVRDPRFHMTLRQDSYTMDTNNESIDVRTVSQTREIKHVTYHRTRSTEPAVIGTGSEDQPHSTSRKGANKPRIGRLTRMVKAGKRAFSRLRPSKSRSYSINQTESSSSSRETLPKPESKKSRHEGWMTEDEDDGIGEAGESGVGVLNSIGCSADSPDGGFRSDFRAHGGHSGGYSTDGIGDHSDNRSNSTTISSHHRVTHNTHRYSMVNDGHYRETRSHHADVRTSRLTASDGSIEIDGVDDVTIPASVETPVGEKHCRRRKNVFSSVISVLRSRSRGRSKEVERGHDECDYGQTSMTRTVHADGYSSTLQTTFTQFHASRRLDVEDTDEDLDKEEVIEECANRLAAIGDAIHSGHAHNLPGNISYSNFEAMIGNQGVGSWSHVAKVFTVTKQLINSHTAKVGEIKEMALRYIADKCAGWLVENGGFETILSEEEFSSVVD